MDPTIWCCQPMHPSVHITIIIMRDSWTSCTGMKRLVNNFNLFLFQYLSYYLDIESMFMERFDFYKTIAGITGQLLSIKVRSSSSCWEISHSFPYPYWQAGEGKISPLLQNLVIDLWFLQYYDTMTVRYCSMYVA